MNKSIQFLFASLLSCQVFGDVSIGSYPTSWPELQLHISGKDCSKILGKYDYDGIFFQAPDTYGPINIHNVFNLSDHQFNANSVASFSLTARKSAFYIDIDVTQDKAGLSNSSFPLGSNCKNGWLFYTKIISGAGDGTPSRSVATYNISVARDGALVIENETVRKEKVLFLLESSSSRRSWYKFDKVIADE
tara:strand:+ start:502 stop:1074 length:573 start_codon:yes stop_codon:yes gene_type:complete